MKRCRSPPAAAPVRPLSSASRLQLVRRITKQTLIRADEMDPNILGISYNSARDELFLADNKNNEVRWMRVRDVGYLRDVYRGPPDTSQHVWSVCHMSDSDSLLVCSFTKGPDQKRDNCWWHLSATAASGARRSACRQTEWDGLVVR